MKKLVIGFATMLLSGCMTMQPLEDELAALTGQDISAAYNVLGYPSEKLDLDSVTVYTWRNISHEMYPYISTSDINGQVGRRSFNAVRTTTEWGPATFLCEIKLGVTDHKIVNSQYQGSAEGCRPFLQRIKAVTENTL